MIHPEAERKQEQQSKGRAEPKLRYIAEQDKNRKGSENNIGIQ